MLGLGILGLGILGLGIWRLHRVSRFRDLGFKGCGCDARGQDWSFGDFWGPWAVSVLLLIILNYTAHINVAKCRTTTTN